VKAAFSEAAFGHFGINYLRAISLKSMMHF